MKEQNMHDPEMEFINALFRSELEKFISASEDVRRQVVTTIAEADALEWLIELCDQDKKMSQAYAHLIDDHNNDA